MPPTARLRRLAAGLVPLDWAPWFWESATGGRIGLMMDDDTTSILYRIAFGHAVRLAGLRGYSATDPRGDRSAIEAEAIRDVTHRHRVVGQADAAIVREAVEDAVVGRRPRW